MEDETGRLLQTNGNAEESLVGKCAAHEIIAVALPLRKSSVCYIKNKITHNLYFSYILHVIRLIIQYIY
jgi:hypothetical protein